MKGIVIVMHQGEVLMRLAKHYHDLHAVILEVVQNAVDAGADRIEVAINSKKSYFTVCDNGQGADLEKITKALSSIGATLKDSNRKYGQFGIGLVSPLAIAKGFTLTSCPSSRQGQFIEYSFESEKIVKQREVVIPHKTVGALFEKAAPVWWRTKVEVYQVSRDKRVSQIKLENLVQDISLKFGEEIKRRSIAVTVEHTDAQNHNTRLQVVVSDYSGQKLETFSCNVPECGNVVIELWLAQMGRRGREGNITFQTTTNPSRVTAQQFVSCTVDMLDPVVGRALTCGVLEGRILCEKIKLHADRTRFESDDALFALCVSIELWYKQCGQKIIENAEENASDKRYQKIGAKIMPFAELLFRQEQFSSLAGSMKVGTTGRGHSDFPKSQIIGKEDATSIASSGDPFGEKTAERDGSGNKDEKSKSPSPEHKPGIVYGPQGRKRTEVKGHSTGLRFEYVEMKDFRHAFVFNPETGTLSFNMNSPLWGSCLASDAILSEYQIAVVTQALTLELFKVNGVVSPEIEKFSDEALAQQVFAIKNSKSFTSKS